MEHSLAGGHLHLVALSQDAVELVVLQHEVVTALVVLLLDDGLQAVLLTIVLAVARCHGHTAGDASAVGHQVVALSGGAEQQYAVVSLDDALVAVLQLVFGHNLGSHLGAVLHLHGVNVDAVGDDHVTTGTQRPVLVGGCHGANHLRALVVVLQTGHQGVVVEHSQCGVDGCCARECACLNLDGLLRVGHDDVSHVGHAVHGVGAYRNHGPAVDGGRNLHGDTLAAGCSASNLVDAQRLLGAIHYAHRHVDVVHFFAALGLLAFAVNHLVLDDEVCRYAALEVGLTRYGDGVQAGLGLCVALHIVLCGGNSQVASLHLSNLGGLCHRAEEVVLEFGLSERYAGQRSRLDGEGSRLRAAVVALTCCGNGSGSGVRVGGVSQRVVGILHEGSLSVLNSYGRRLGCAVVGVLGCTQRNLELSLGLGRNDVELGSSRVLEVALTCNGYGVFANVCALIAAHFVAVGSHRQIACLHACHGHGLLLLVVGQSGLSQYQLGQFGLCDGHLEALCSHVVVVGIGHHLVVNGVFLGLEARRQSRRVVHVVERVLHLAALCATCGNQRLRQCVEHQSCLCCRSCRGDVGGLDGEGSRLCAAVVALTCYGNGSGSGVRVGGVSQRVVGILHEGSLSVLNGYGRRLGCAVVGVFVCAQRDVEQVGVGSHDAPVCGYRALEVALTGQRGGVVAHVRCLVVGNLVACIGNGDSSGADDSHQCGLLLLVVDEVRLGQRSSGQGGLFDGHLEALCSHVVVVGIGHHLVVNGVFLGFGASRNVRAPSLVVE